MTCYEHLRKNIQDAETYNRLDNYFRAIQENKTDEYHKKHGRGKNDKLY
jgi:hypothetical protein